ncbi:hypothetical protein [Methanobacterium aggregans]|uniref:hypothetical protein n=1 Tax=Methanobacterium aggregans TaxID=1615586 RepID=UPI001AE63662|nr:hypothetical protein [Methanobacterium aggregans]MBP2045274.1 hypothetical protein [Methanobacterium aggregans]
MREPCGNTYHSALRFFQVQAPQFNPPRVGPDYALLSWISPQSVTLHPAQAPVSPKVAVPGNH